MPPHDAHAAIDAAYHAKYDRYGPRIVNTVVGDQVVATTLRLDAVDGEPVTDAAGASATRVR